jgi:hypothetical protein
MNPHSPIMQHLPTNNTQSAELSQLAQPGRQGIDTATFTPTLDQNGKKLCINPNSLNLL